MSYVYASYRRNPLSQHFTSDHHFGTTKVRIPSFTIYIVWVFKLCSLIFISSFVL
ncbi:hypothetical protein HanXRQr2_Chr07g0294561 [Helianthus annuus]|uniref:Uncharacterized protein n=1 Tax=Helianthus annuus TaxID=4232 RepID=A0A9K3IKD0_HELAN|nr:hypothetical protein HanXRQr2_Chr07g0294561 [Helianthus annuus]KAJ0904688.1 hypothetical protein HanPSC8_Chr07g0285171 [Helianthus annuus]